MTTEANDNGNVADFEAARNHTLAKRMRAAQASGHVPLWQRKVTLSDEADDADEDAPPPDALGAVPDAARASSGDSNAVRVALSTCAIALLVALIVGIHMWRHNATYNYSD